MKAPDIPAGTFFGWSSMSKSSTRHWNPKASEILENPLLAYDAMRAQCPVAHSDYLGWSVFRHADVMAVLTDHEHFSNAVSSHLSVPNGMDPPEHTPYRRLVESYFNKETMQAFAPAVRQISHTLCQALATGRNEIVQALAQPFSLQVQSAFMGWPDTLHQPLAAWIKENHAATLAGDKIRQANVALAFDGYIREQLQHRRINPELNDITARLCRENVDGHLLSDASLVSLIRNWTVGELGTITACVGLLVDFLAHHPHIQQELRQDMGKIPEAIEEILRIDGPLPGNRRVTTARATVGGQAIEKGERLTLMWGAANRDETVFADPATFAWGRDHGRNLLYGAGIHVCPGAPLARLELHILMETLLTHTRAIRSDTTKPTRAHYPAAGFQELYVIVE